MRRKIFLTGATLLVSTFVGQTVSARTLEDILKEKGVITEADYKEVTKSKPFSYKIGKGFTLMSPDEKFGLTIGGYIQPRYSFFDRDHDNPNTATAPRQDASEFRVRRAKFVLSGNAFTKDLTYKLQIEFTSGANNNLLDDAWMNYRLIDEVQIRAGQDKVPFSRQWLTSATALSFIERSLASDTFFAGRDTGVQLLGKVLGGKLNYALGGFGGAGQSELNPDNDNAFVARVVVNPLGDMPYQEADIDVSQKPLVSVGANYYRQTFLKSAASTPAATPPATATGFAAPNDVRFAAPASGTSFGGWLGRGAGNFLVGEKIDVDTLGFDIAFKWMGIAIQGEYYYGQGEGGTSNAFLRAQGGYGQIGYMIIPKHLEAAFRYSIVDPNTRVGGDMRMETQGAVSYYFNNHYLKLQADITNAHQQQGAALRTDDMIYRMQAQLMF